MKKSLLAILTILGLLTVLPSGAKVAVKRQSPTKSSGAPTADVTYTDDRGFISIFLNGAYSARIYADEQGNTHMAYKETSTSTEEEVTPESLGFEYDVMPDKVANFLTEHPSFSIEAAYEYFAYDKQDEVLKAALEKGLIFNSNDFWKNAAIYLAGYNEVLTGVNTTLTMTGGQVYSIVAAGETVSAGGASGASQESAKPTDTGDATIYVQGGTVTYVSPSATGTHTFTGTVHIYMQNCTYAGQYIPYLHDNLCTATILTTGVTYEYDTAVLSSSNSNAAYNVLQSKDGSTVTCFGTGSLITLPSNLLPIDCETSFTINAGTRVSTSVNITTKTFDILSPDLEPSTYTLYVTSGTTVNTEKINIGANAVVRNMGTVNVEACNGYTCNGTWQVSYIMIVREPKTYYCNAAVIGDHQYNTTIVYGQTADEVLGVKLNEDQSVCKWGCGTHAPTYGQLSYPDTYDITGKAFTAEKTVTCSKITYTRDFTTTNYQALYLPYALSYDKWSADADIYRIKNIHEYDDDNDGDVDRWTLEIVKMKEGQSTKANTPYVIKPKAMGSMTLTSDANAVLYATNVPQSIDCSSTDCKFVFTGTPASKDIAANTDFYMTGGSLCYGTTDQTLGTYRWYMSIYDRETGDQILPAAFNTAKSITVFCEEDGDSTTAVREVNQQNDVSSTAVYDLNGRQVRNMAPGRIYIVNGHKVIK